jgi:hypothetical protein
MLGTRQVDSRAYVHAYRIRSTADLPADFPVSQTGSLLAGLFLPMDQERRREGPRYPARILVLRRDALICAAHPSADTPETTVRVDEIVAVETGSLLLDSWLKVIVPGKVLICPYETRNCEPVTEFLLQLKMLLFVPREDLSSEQPRSFGEVPSYKLVNAEAAEIEPDETPLLRFWTCWDPSAKWSPPSWHRSWPGDDYLALTSRRLLWITECLQHRRHPYGTIRASAPIQKLMAVGCVKREGWGEIVLRFSGEIEWQIPVPAGREEDAACFTTELRRMCL